jgi:hypothetical protein
MHTFASPIRKGTKVGLKSSLGSVEGREVSSTTFAYVVVCK